MPEGWLRLRAVPTPGHDRVAEPRPAKRQKAGLYLEMAPTRLLLNGLSAVEYFERSALRDE